MISQDVRLGKNVVIPHPEQDNLYGCEIGDGTKISSFVEIRKQTRIGCNVKIQPFVFIPEGVTVEDGVLVGPHVCFTNDKHPRAVNPGGSLMEPDDWEVVPTLVKRGASIGAGAVIVCGITIGEMAMVGAGAVATRDVPSHSLVVGVPARVVGRAPDSSEDVSA